MKYPSLQNSFARLLLIAILFSLIVLLMIAFPVNAAPRSVITVNSLADTLADDGNCTLREAINAANSNTPSGVMSGECAAGTDGMNTIDFSVTGTISLTSSLTIAKDLTITAPLGGITLDGNDSVNILEVGPGMTVNLSYLTFIRGRSAFGGNAIYSYGFLNLSSSTFLSNTTTFENGGAIVNEVGGVLSISNTTFYGNSTTSQYSHGGAIMNSGSLIVTNTNFISNSAYTGGAIFDGGILMVIVSSTFTSNISRDTGSGGNSGGGAIEIHGGSTTISYSNFEENVGGTGGGIYFIGGDLGIGSTTFYSNTAAGFGGGGIFGNGYLTVTKSTFYRNHAPQTAGGAIESQGALTIINSTFTENDARVGGGTVGYVTWITNSTFFSNSASGTLGGSIGPGTTSLYNTIVASSPSGGNCYGTIINGGNNIDDGTTCAWGSTNGSRSNTNPLLGLLQDNGGSTQTIGLLSGSPAIDGVIFNIPNGCPPIDQRGVARPIGLRCDIGAYESDYLLKYIFFPLIFR